LLPPHPLNLIDSSNPSYDSIFDPSTNSLNTATHLFNVHFTSILPVLALSAIVFAGKDESGQKPNQRVQTCFKCSKLGQKRCAEYGQWQETCIADGSEKCWYTKVYDSTAMCKSLLCLPTLDLLMVDRH
jgi:hypothetical protein